MYVKHFALSPQEEGEEADDHLDSATIVKVGDGNDNTMIMNTASSVQSQDTMIVNSDAGTLLESDLGTMVINSDEDEDATMKSTFWKIVLMLNVTENVECILWLMRLATTRLFSIMPLKVIPHICIAHPFCT